MEETIIENTKNEENSNVTVENSQKKSNGAMGVAAAAAAGAVFGAAAGVAGTAAAAELFESESEPLEEQPLGLESESEPTPTNSAWDGSLEVSRTNFDNMSFNDAFAAARAEVGPGGMFMYHGKPYNTFYAEEYSALTDDDKIDFQQQVNTAMHDPELQHVSNEPTPAEPIAEVTTVEVVNDGNNIEVPIDLSTVSENDIQLVDVDGDGTMDAVTIDTNSDGYVDAVVADIDGDGNADVIMDTNNDGVFEVYHNVDENGNAESMELIDPEEQMADVDLETNSEFASLDDSFLDVDNDMNMTDYA